MATALPSAPGSARAWLVVAVLCFGSIVSMIDRQVINLLVDPLKADLGLSDTQISLLQGFAFATFYAVMAIPLGRLADTGNRKAVIVGGAILFSAASASCGLATGFATLFVARMATGVGEATLAPAGFSLISDHFPRERLGVPLSLFTGMSFVGSGLALIFIGWLLGLLGERPTLALPGLGVLADWQLAFILATLPGLLFVALMLTVREPMRRDHGGGAALGATFAEVVRFASDNRRTLVPIYVGLPLLAASQFSLNAWVPSFFMRVHGMEASEIGPVFGTMVATLSTAGVFASGWLADRLAGRGRRDAYLLVPMLAGLAAIPFAFAFPLAGSASTALLLLAPLMFVGSMPFGAGTAAIPAIAPNRMRAQLVAVYMLVGNLVGAGAGPWLVAVATDRLFGDPLALGRSLALVVPLLAAAGALVIGLGARALRRQA